MQPINDPSSKQSEDNSSQADLVLNRMLERVRAGQWQPGTVLPGQRQLVNEFGVSAVPLREALSMLKTMGILDIRHGHKTTVRRMDTQILEQLLPLAFHLEGEQGFTQIAELRLALEPRSAALAAVRRTSADVEALTELVATLRAKYENDAAGSLAADWGFHVRIASATGNPFYMLLLKTFSSYFTYAQNVGCAHSRERRFRAVISHESILDAIVAKDAQRAFVEMEAHLRYSATHYLQQDAIGPATPPPPAAPLHD